MATMTRMSRARTTPMAVTAAIFGLRIRVARALMRGRSMEVKLSAG